MRDKAVYVWRESSSQYIVTVRGYRTAAKRFTNRGDAVDYALTKAGDLELDAFELSPKKIHK